MGERRMETNKELSLDKEARRQFVNSFIWE